jgi:protein associated with RNAse G/E
LATRRVGGNMQVNIGDNIIIQSYKHNQQLHRIWKHETIIEDNDDYIVVANKRTKVVEANGRFWYTREPSVSFFFKHHWYNVIAILKKEKITFYCNMASPALIDDEAIKYIDYDLDLRVDSDFSYRVVDIHEFKMHSKEMDYSDRITRILAKETLHLRSRIDQQTYPFNHDLIRKLYNRFITIEEEKRQIEKVYKNV